jgi:5,10-methylene-tetrahydrofolate dehydrogenase/methenyl tetrahydrofolate cyclohydrolase
MSSIDDDTTSPSRTTTTTVLGQVIDGKAIADTIRSELALMLREEISNNSKLNNNNVSVARPGLAVMLVGNRKDSETYVRMKQKACLDVGIVSTLQTYPNTDITNNNNNAVTEEILLQQIQAWNNDPAIHGILVQLPLPPYVNEGKIVGAIHPSKDVDGLHPMNVAKLYNTATHASSSTSTSASVAESSSSSSSQQQDPPFDWKDFNTLPFHIPCTPQGCIELLDRIYYPIAGKRAVVIGRSNLVGLPVSMLLLHRNASVTVVHSQSINIHEIIQQADIVIAAAGRPTMIQSSWLKEGCVVIDVGINAITDTSTKRGYKLVGDVDYDNAKNVASWITPVPGGVGPMTIAMLLRNTINSWKRGSVSSSSTTSTVVVDNKSTTATL